MARGRTNNVKLSGVERLYWTLKSLRDPFQLALSIGVSASLTGASLVGFPDVFTWPAGWWLVGAGVCGVTWTIGRLTFLRPTYLELARSEEKAKRQSIESRDALQRSLDAIIRRVAVHVCEDGHDCRISAYSVEDDEFVLLARYSSNPNHERRGRPAYPLHQGAIGAAWANGSVVENTDAVTRASWEEAICADNGFSPAVAKNLTMVARSICAVRLNNGAEKVGVIVLESETHQKFGVPQLKKVRSSLLLDAIAEIVGVAHSHMPRVLERKSERTGTKADITIPEPHWKSPAHVEVGVANELELS